MNQQYKTLSIRVLCELFGKTRLAYYDHKKRESRQDNIHLVTLELVTIIREDMPRLGSKKLHYLINPTLQRQGIKMGRDALHELLRVYGMTVKKRRYYPRTTWSEHWLRKYPNLIENFIPLNPNELWVSDITYIRLQNDFAYLSLITDVYSHKIVGYYLCDTLKAIGSINALQMALENLSETDKLIHHSDRGIQYCSYDYTDLRSGRNIKISMTENGDPRENAIAERANGILKVELGLGKTFINIILARKAVVKEISTYNSKRPHMSCNMLTPEQAHQMSGKLEKKWKNYYKSKINKCTNEKK
jgi:transposase InsO family protein